jgi:hypothetical protein
MPFFRKAFYVSTILAALSFTLLLSAREARADAIVITGGFSAIASPFTPPRYVSSAFDLQGTNFRATGGAGDAPAGSVRSSCASPCLQGATFSISSGTSLPVATLGGLTLDGQTRSGFFDGSGLAFTSGLVTIPLDAELQLTLTTTFSMSGTVNFQEINTLTGGLTGFTFSTDVVGSGIASFSLVFSNLTHEYEIRSARYDFQPVPEPTALLLFGAGLTGVVARYRRRVRT